jgi:DNA ligase-associated metallophosphoesterase
MSLAVDIGGHPVVLLPERALYLSEHRTLLVADAHFGKAQSFRRLGVPVPRGTTAHNLAVLTTLIDRTAAAAVVFLGDLLHARRGRSADTLQAVQAWRLQHAQIDMTLVRGNHDSRAGDPPPEWAMHTVDEPWRVGAFALCHHPAPVEGAYTLAGHLHPAVVIGQGFDRVRLPCFHFGVQVGVLPALGDFTGLHVVQPRADERVFVVAAGQVLEWPA